MTIYGNENYQFQANFCLICKDCSSSNLTFQIFEQGNNEGDAILYNTSDDNKKVILGVTCCNCGSGYTLELKI